MKRILTFVMAVAIAVSAIAAPKKSGELNLRVGSYNVWSHSARAWQIKKKATTASRNWENSKKAVAKQILTNDHESETCGSHVLLCTCVDNAEL